jgi:hypothetical protein
MWRLLTEEYRRAFFENDKCALWLYPNAQERSVEINRLVFDGGIQQTISSGRFSSSPFFEASLTMTSVLFDTSAIQKHQNIVHHEH